MAMDSSNAYGYGDTSNAKEREMAHMLPWQMQQAMTMMMSQCAVPNPTTKTFSQKVLCTNKAQKRGVCVTHGVKVERSGCSYEECTNIA